MNEDIEYKEKLFKQFSASKVLGEIYNELRKEFGEKLFMTSHRMAFMELEEFSQKNKRNDLIGHIISGVGSLNMLSHFVTDDDNELVLSDEVIRRLKKIFKKIYLTLFGVLAELTEDKAKKSSDE